MLRGNEEGIQSEPFQAVCASHKLVCPGHYDAYWCSPAASLRITAKILFCDSCLTSMNHCPITPVMPISVG